MKTFTKILMMVAIIVMLHSCTDIADLGNNTTKIPILSQITKEDSLNFLDFKTILFGDIRINQIVYSNAVLNNQSDALTIVIYDIKLKNNFGFDIYPEYGFPVVIQPLQSNSDNQLVARWNTNVVTPGYYKDTVYLNGSQQVMLFIQGNVIP